MGRFVMEFIIEKETKNKYRYRAVESKEAPAVENIYIQKWAAKQLNGGKVPEKIKVTVELP